MDQNSCFITNPDIVTSSKRIVVFAERIAKDCNLIASDLILAAVWHCLNQSKKTSEVVSTKCKEKESKTKKIEIIKVHNTAPNRPLQSEPASSGNKNIGKSVQCTKLVVEENNEKEKEKLSTSFGKEVSSIEEVLPGVVSELNVENLQNTSLQTHSNKKLNDDGLIDEYSVANKQETNVETKEESTKLISDNKSTSSGVEEIICIDEEVISLNDEDSNEAGEEIGTDEIVEEKEQDYFDMDCDEIDDDADDEDDYDIEHNTTTNLEVIESSQRNKCGGKSIKSKKVVTGEEVTVICDSESEDNENIDSDDKSNEKINSTLDSSKDTSDSISESEKKCLNTKSIEDNNTKSVKDNKKVSCFDPCKGTVITSTKNSIRAATDNEESGDERSSGKLENDFTLSVSSFPSSASALLGLMPVCLARNGSKTTSASAIKMEEQHEIDALPSTLPARSTYISSERQIINLTSHQPVHQSGYIDHSVQQARTILDQTTVSDQMVYISSSVMQGCISSLPAVEDLQQVHVPLQQVDVPVSSSMYEDDGHTAYPVPPPRSAYFQPAGCSGTSELPEAALQTTKSSALSPPRKKRLLDHDKKWHTEPKYSPGQDKYLAMPGGVDKQGASVEQNIPGKYKYASISHNQYYVMSEPKVGIETVDSDYVNQESLNFENCASNDSNLDEGQNVDDIDGVGNVDRRKLRGKCRGRARGNGRGTRGSRGNWRGKRESRGNGHAVIGTRGNRRGHGRVSTRSRGASVVGYKGVSLRGRGVGKGLTRGFLKNVINRGAFKGVDSRTISQRGSNKSSVRGSVVTKRGTSAKGSSYKFLSQKVIQKKKIRQGASTSSNTHKSLTARKMLGSRSVTSVKPRKSKDISVEKESSVVVKRGPGRPRKYGSAKELVNSSSKVSKARNQLSTVLASGSAGPSSGMKKRGRPPKRTSEEKDGHFLKDGVEVIVID